MLCKEPLRDLDSSFFSLPELVHIEGLFSVSDCLLAVFLLSSTFSFVFYIFIHFELSFQEH